MELKKGSSSRAPKSVAPTVTADPTVHPVADIKVIGNSHLTIIFRQIKRPAFKDVFVRRNRSEFQLVGTQKREVEIRKNDLIEENFKSVV